jgi:hypothetical protein
MGNQHVTRPSIEEIGARVLRSWWFLGLASAAIFGLLVLASWPWWLNRFVLKVATRTVEISASAPGVHEIGANLLKGNEIQIFGADTTALPPELASLADATSAVRFVASRAILQKISLPSGAGLIVRITSEGGVDIGLLNDGLISLAISGMIERINENGRPTTITNIERTISWEIKPADRNNPARIVFPPGTQPFALYNQPIGHFWFRTPGPAGEDPRTLQSELLKGEIQVLDTGTKIELEPRELVLLEGGSWMLSRLEVIDKAIAVDISGEADRISVGPPRPGSPFRLDRDLTPSILSYLFGQHELKLAWGMALAVLGALWKARQWALKRGS